MRRTLAVACLVLLLGLTLSARSPGPVSACECADWPAPREAFAQADIAFSGNVLSVTPTWRGDTVTFAVISTWKASASAQVEVIGPPFCEREFAIGETYLVYGTFVPRDAAEKLGLPPGSYLGVVPCNRTQTLAGAGADLAALGPGTAPRQPGSALPPAGHGGDLSILWWLLCALLLVAMGSRLRRVRI